MTSDLALIAERLAGAIALGREHEALTERATRFAALAEFARRISASLDPDEAYPVICAAIAEVLPSDMVALAMAVWVIGRKPHSSDDTAMPARVWV